MGKLFSRLFQADFFPFAVKGGLVNPQDLRGFRKAGGPRKDFSQMDFLNFFQGNQGANLHGIPGIAGTAGVMVRHIGG